MISQAFIEREKNILMVNQYTKCGKNVWTFPGGHVEKHETSIEACIREVKEETNFNVDVYDLLYSNNNKYIYLCSIISGNLFLDKQLVDNKEIIEVNWISIHDYDKFDLKTNKILNLYLEKFSN